MTPHSEKHLSPPFPPVTSSSLSWTIAKGPRLASCVASGTAENSRYRYMCGARCGGPMTLSRTTDADLDRAFVENAIFSHANP